ncbi:MAG: hypothetical protein CL942_11790 [Desulfovibrio sp.]|nr:hypothetical protein [Desulfovibrio sp.]|tara:strand:- start:22644 stop:23387 length:744 start_codon:yes stop_codon:yes gene_type:complete
MMGKACIHWYILLLAAFSGVALFPSNGNCGEVLEGYSAALAPYEMASDGAVDGLAHEMMRAVSREAGFNYRPKKQLGNAIAGIPPCGEGHMLLAVESLEVAPCWERLGPVFTTAQVAVGLKRTPLRSLRDVRGKRVALVRASSFEPASTLSNVVLYRTEQYEDSLRLLVLGKVDYVVGSQVGIQWAAGQMGAVSKALGTPLELGREEVTIYISMDSVIAEKRGVLQKSLIRAMEKGVFLEILRKYGL